jgi:hypothetical protein
VGRRRCAQLFTRRVCVPRNSPMRFICSSNVVFACASVVSSPLHDATKQSRNSQDSSAPTPLHASTALLLRFTSVPTLATSVKVAVSTSVAKSPYLERHSTPIEGSTSLSPIGKLPSRTRAAPQRLLPIDAEIDCSPSLFRSLSGVQLGFSEPVTAIAEPTRTSGQVAFVKSPTSNNDGATLTDEDSSSLNQRPKTSNSLRIRIPEVPGATSGGPVEEAMRHHSPLHSRQSRHSTIIGRSRVHSPTSTVASQSPSRRLAPLTRRTKGTTHTNASHGIEVMHSTSSIGYVVPGDNGSLPEDTPDVAVIGLGDYDIDVNELFGAEFAPTAPQDTMSQASLFPNMKFTPRVAVGLRGGPSVGQPEPWRHYPLPANLRIALSPTLKLPPQLASLKTSPTHSQLQRLAGGTLEDGFPVQAQSIVLDVPLQDSPLAAPSNGAEVVPGTSNDFDALVNSVRMSYGDSTASERDQVSEQQCSSVVQVPVGSLDGDNDSGSEDDNASILWGSVKVKSDRFSVLTVTAWSEISDSKSRLFLPVFDEFDGSCSEPEMELGNDALPVRRLSHVIDRPEARRPQPSTKPSDRPISPVPMDSGVQEYNPAFRDRDLALKLLQGLSSTSKLSPLKALKQVLQKRHESPLESPGRMLRVSPSICWSLSFVSHKWSCELFPRNEV